MSKHRGAAASSVDRVPVPNANEDADVAKSIPSPVLLAP